MLLFHSIPLPLESYNDNNLTSIIDILIHRTQMDPFNLFATIIFFLAIIHSFMTSWFLKRAHEQELHFKELQKKGLKDSKASSISAGFLHFMGEIEAVFGLWAIILGIGATFFYDWQTFVRYVESARYIEPIFVIVIMTIASSRPILKLFELILWKIVKLFGGTLEAWWFAILTLGPILGSFITGPAAMVVSSMLLVEKFYELHPNEKLKYATIALLFVNISVGGTLTNFASPPILMIAGVWHWDNVLMMTQFGWKALFAVVVSNLFFYLILRKDLKDLKIAYANNQFRKYVQRRFISKKELELIFDYQEREINKHVGFTTEFAIVCGEIKEKIKLEAYNNMSKEEIEKYSIDSTIDEGFELIKINEMKRTIPGLLSEEDQPDYRDPHWDSREDKVPYWMMAIHVGFMLWTLANAHEPVMFIAGFLFFLGFFQVTSFYQNRIDLKPALMVGFFLAGLVVHGGLQGWWIQPVLSNLDELPLNFMAIVLTSFNDNAAITYLCSLVPDFSDSMKYSVVAGAVTGGGLTVIANSPNPIGQSILKRYFKNGISAIKLFEYALPPTIIAGLCFMLLK